MIQVLIELLFFRGLTIHRWNNFPRIENISILDNAGFIIHIALFLAHIEEKNGSKIDREFLIKRVLFSVFSKLALSDINSGTLRYINKIDSEIFSNLQDKVFKNIFKLDGPDFIKEDMQKILKDTSHKLELQIIDAARNYSGLQECIINSKVFPDVYDIPTKEIQLELTLLKKDLVSLEILMDSDKYKTYLSQIRRLSHSQRWPGEQRKYNISVMAHLYIVTFFAYIIGSFEIEKGKDYNMLDFLLKGIYHDIPEVITGDVITPTKNAIVGFKKALEKVEEKMMDDFFFVYVDREYEKTVKHYMLDPFTSEQGKYVKQGDIFSMVFESKIEVTHDNEKFKAIFNDMLDIGKRFNTVSSKYIVDNCVDGFGKTNFNTLLK